jgi:hypothetical protein
MACRQHVAKRVTAECFRGYRPTQAKPIREREGSAQGRGNGIETIEKMLLGEEM